MEKKSIDSSRELQCVGRMEVMKPKPVGFLCGSIPVSTDASFHVFNSALLRSKTRENAPRYRMLPTATDLKVLPIGVHPQPKASRDVSLGSSAIASNFSRKCEALAVTGLVEYGDEIDVIAPADILKQIFNMPYSKARLSIAVKRIGQTLVLNSGPDVEEGEKLTRRHSCQSKGTDQSLFLNFAMHSVRMEACDCPPSHLSSDQQTNSSVLSGMSESRDSSLRHSSYHAQGDRLHFYGGNVDYANNVAFKCDSHSDCSPAKLDDILWESEKNKSKKGPEAFKKASHIGGKPRCSLKESEKYKRAGNDGFLRILFWQFHNFRMLLGSDLLLFSNEKYTAVSLHLWDISRQVTPLTWLEAWLDNVMASVPELAICYHENGVVQGYELLKTDDILLLKGISEDGMPAFHPHVVEQNGLTVLRFLQENCKQDPGAYWLYKNAGDDAIQLFDLSVPKNHPTNVSDDSSPLPSVFHRGRSDSKFSLGTLLYRIAHRLSLSMDPNNRSKCAQFFKKCFDFLDEPDHLVVRAIAHEQFARLILSYEEGLDLTSESFPEESEVVVSDADEESLDLFGKFCQSVTHEKVFHEVPGEESNGVGSTYQESMSDVSPELALETNTRPSKELMMSSDTELIDIEVFPAQLVKNVSDPIASKLAAIHHVSQAIKSLRWRRQLQSTESGQINHGNQTTDGSLPVKFSVCVCGDVECIEVCDIREWLPTLKLDHKLWKLVLLLGESYLALGDAYKDDNQLYQALRVVGLACSVYGSMPQNLEDVRYVSSIGSTYRSRMRSEDQSEDLAFEQLSSTYLYWAKAWMLVGDVYVEFHKKNGKEVSIQIERKSSLKELRMSSEVVKEVTRLRKQLGQVKSNCSFCSLVNCSCQSDRADSGSSASSSSGDTQTSGYGRKQSKRFHSKSSSSSFVRKPEGGLNDRGNVCSRNGHGTMEPSNTANCKVDAAAFAALDYEEIGTTMEIEIAESVMPDESEAEPPGKSQVGNGGIFRYLGVPSNGAWDYYLITALSCYDEARKALAGLSCGSEVLQAVVKRKGWVCNELGRKRLERKELDKAELAFADAINAFKDASDFTNIVLINCNLGHGRRSLAEEIVCQIASLKEHLVFRNAYKDALETAKQEYARSLKYYVAAKSELKHLTKGIGHVVSSLRNEVYTQLGHTYLRFGMLLASEDTVAVVDVNMGDASIHCCSAGGEGPFRELKKPEISANDAIREALSAYESVGDLCIQEIAYTYFQLACYQRDCCLQFLIPHNMRRSSLRGEKSNLQRMKQYASLADRNWLRAMDFYGPKTHPTMYLTILMERSALSLSLSGAFHSNSMMESALCSLLEGRRLIGETCLESLKKDKICAKFWNQLQLLLKKMLATTKSCPGSQTVSSNKSGEVGKLRELYKMSLRSTDLNQLQEMHCLWTDQPGSFIP